MAGQGWGRAYRREQQRFAVLNTGTADTTQFAGLDTSASVNDDASNVTASGTEPSSSNGYARVAITWADPALPANDAACNALNSNSLAWTSSGGGFSTGATTLKSVTIWRVSTLANVAEADFLGRAPLATPFAVSATGITITIAASALVMGSIGA